MPQFETFKKRQRMPEASPYITIQKRGTIGFNRSAYQAMGSPKAIELLYDTTAQIMGVRGVDLDVEHAYPIRHATDKHDGSFLASGRAFTQYYNIDTATARRYRAYMEDGVLCIDMSAEGVEVAGNGRSTQRSAAPSGGS